MAHELFILSDFGIAALTPGPSPKGRGEIFKTRSYTEVVTANRYRIAFFDVS